MDNNRDIRGKVLELITLQEQRQGVPYSVRSFCERYSINYKSLYNAFKSGNIGIHTVYAFKKAVPDLNLNWFLFSEGDPFCPNNVPQPEKEC